jgi:xanthine dehydrogenase iron-sulfur cluster and FAD-binding subunit A
MRASAEYRARAAENMLMRYYYDIEREPVDIRKVRA